MRRSLFCALGVMAGCPGPGAATSSSATETTTSTSSTSSTSSTTSTSSTGVEPTGSTTAAVCGPAACAAEETCLDGAQCACLPGLVLCGARCVDLAADPDHCGRCGAACAAGCAGGVCGGTPPTGPSAEAPIVIAGAEGANACRFYNEAKPERSINALPEGATAFVAAQRGGAEVVGGRAHFNAADASGVWPASTPPIPGLPDHDVLFDPWTATHGGAGLEYATVFGGRTGEARCVMVAATDAASLRAGVWTRPFACASPPESDLVALPDGPVLVADHGDDALYVAYHRVSVLSRLIVQRYWPCAGVPRPDASEGCPLHWSRRFVPQGVIDEHVNVVVNPCTHHPLVLLRERDEGATTHRIRMLALATTDGAPLADLVVDTVEFAGNTRCGDAACPDDEEICKCTGAGSTDCADTSPGCLDLAARVHGAALLGPGGTCRLYLAYDRSVTAADGERYMRSRLQVFDLVGDAPSPALTLDSSPDAAARNEFGGAVLADWATGAVGLFFYRQEGGDPCATRYVGLVRRDGPTFAELTLSAPFPSMRFDFTDGLGHYVAGGRFSEPGVLLPAWSQPLATTAPCQPCQGQDYSLAVMASRVVP